MIESSDININTPVSNKKNLNDTNPNPKLA